MKFTKEFLELQSYKEGDQDWCNTPYESDEDSDMD